MNKKILISTSTFAEFDKTPFSLLKKNKFDFILNPYGRKLNAEEIISLGKEAVGIVAGTEKLYGKVFEQMPNLKIISRCGTGMDNVDLAAAKKYGIRVYNTPDAPTLAVAELTIALVLNLLRKINQMERGLRSGGWEKLMGNLLQGKKIGIVGFGRIGQKVCKLFACFNAETAYYDLEAKKSTTKCRRKGFGELLKWADIITLHVSGAARPVISNRELKKMKKGSWLINVSRGGVVDEKALYQALKKGHLAGAAVDVFEEEPYKGPLNELPNVILTPHVGSYAKEARINMEVQAVENLLAGLKESN